MIEPQTLPTSQGARCSVVLETQSYFENQRHAAGDQITDEAECQPDTLEPAFALDLFAPVKPSHDVSSHCSFSRFNWFDNLLCSIHILINAASFDVAQDRPWS